MFGTVLLIVGLVVSAVLCVYFYSLASDRKSTIKEIESSYISAKHNVMTVSSHYQGLLQELEQVKDLHKEALNKINKLTNQKKSSEVRTGLIVEQMAPFLKDFPYDPRNACFLGKPIDFIVFDENGIHFVEIKSGKSRLNKVQRRVKEQVENGLTTFEIYRIKGEK